MRTILAGLLLAQVLSAAGHAQQRDRNGGTIARGKPAVCLVDQPERERCVFFPRDGDGSFAIRTSAGSYYANRIGPNRMSIGYDNGAGMVPQGVFVRSKDDRGCWVQKPDRQICAW